MGCQWIINLIVVLLSITAAALADKLDFYSHPVMDIHGEIVSLEKYRGKVSLVVNVASQCGYTENHYKNLVTLQDLLASTGKFTILAFPCNQFGRQEPGTNEEILRFAKGNGVNFPIFGKATIKGQDALDAWTYLIKMSGQEPDWNFWKYLVDHRGQVVKAWGPWTDPLSLYGFIKPYVDAADGAKDGGGHGSKERGGEL